MRRIYLLILDGGGLMNRNDVNDVFKKGLIERYRKEDIREILSRI